MSNVFGISTASRAHTLFLVVVCLLASSQLCLAAPLPASEQSAVLQLLNAFPSLTVIGPAFPWNRSDVANICDYSGTPNWFTCVSGSIQMIEMYEPHPSPVCLHFLALNVERLVLILSLIEHWLTFYLFFFVLMHVNSTDPWGYPVQDQFDRFSGLTALSRLYVLLSHTPLCSPLLINVIHTLSRSIARKNCETAGDAGIGALPLFDCDHN